jgi:putative transposase
MSALHHLAFSLALAHCLAPCLLLFAWLLRHREVSVAPYVGARRRSTATGTSGCDRHPRTKPEWVREKVIYLASHLPSCRQVEFVFNRWQGLHETIGHTYAWQVMRDHAEEIRALRRARRRRKPRFIPAHHTWALDLTFIRSPWGTTFTVLAIIDAGSRRLLALKVVPGKCALMLLGYVLIAIARFGAPHAIRTDNEPMFHSRLWRRALQALKVHHVFGPAMQPWRNGRIERFFGTLKNALRNAASRSAKELNRELTAFAGYYNFARPHAALGGLTPYEVWRGTSMADVQLAHAHGLGEELLVAILAGFAPARC